MQTHFLSEGPRPHLESIKLQAPRGNQRFYPLPPPTGNPPYHLSLEDVLSSDEVDKIHGEKKLVFHCLGDSGGIKEPSSQYLVANGLEGTDANFFYHLGDVVYYNGQAQEYYPQFYDPYQYYKHPIFAIPGNHDGEPLRNGNEKSLEAFVRNFCAKSTDITPDAGEINRSPMVQPNVYWTLETPYAIIIGLYTNVPEGGQVDQDQINWFENELTSANNDNGEKAIIVTLHHPVFSLDRYHSGSQAMLNLLDNAFENTGVLPSAVLTGHVHNYQRFTRTHQGNKKVPYIVAGAGGYWHLHWMQESVPPLTSLPMQLQDRQDVVLEKYNDDHHGFMKIQITPTKLLGEYYIVPRPHESWHASLAPTLYDHFEFQISQ